MAALSHVCALEIAHLTCVTVALPPAASSLASSAADCLDSLAADETVLAQSRSA
jgi:hypothetical protein